MSAQPTSEPTLARAVDDAAMKHGIEPADRAIDQLMDLWIRPEVKRRQEAGAPKPFVIDRAQVLFSDSNPPIVRLNEQVRGTFKLKATAKGKPGDPVVIKKIKAVEGYQLEDADKNYGHITLVVIGHDLHMVFNLRRNRADALKLLSRASEYLGAAKLTLQNNMIAPCIDNLFGACELLARSHLITLVMNPAVKTHSVVHSSLNAERHRGNVDATFVEMFNRLFTERLRARYETDVLMPPTESDLKIVETQIDIITARYRDF